MKKSMMAAIVFFVFELGAILMLVNFTLSYQDNKEILDYQITELNIALSEGDVEKQQDFADWAVESRLRVDHRLFQMAMAGAAAVAFGVGGVVCLRRSRHE